MNLVPIGATAQETDTIFVKRGSVLQYADTSIVLRKDTALIAADTVGMRIRDDGFTRFFYNFIKIGDQSEQEMYQGLRGFDDRDAFYIGKTVRQINFTKLDPFGTDILEPKLSSDNWLIRTGNLLHIQSQDRMLLNYLYFQPGDKIKPFEVGDSERLLREQSFIKDARVFVEYSPDSIDFVDVRVIEKDIWSLILNFGFPEKNTTEVGFEERNFLGLGLRLDQRFRINLSKGLGYIGIFRAPNIRGSYTSAQLGYSNIPGLRFFNAAVSRRFITPDIRYGGGGDYTWRNKIDTIYPADQPIYTHDIGFNEAGVWLGYNIPVNRRANAERRAGIAASLGYRWTDYFKRPVTEADSLLYQNSRLYIGSISLSRRQYYTDNLLLGYGRTEDIPTGLLIELTGGYETGEFTDQPYGSLSAGWAANTSRAGYFATRAAFGGFFTRDRIDRGTLAFQLQYFSPLAGADRPVKQRTLLGFDIYRGINRRSNEIRRIDSRFGVRGLSSDSLRGQSTAVFSANHNFFTPWRPLGFRFAATVFADVGFFSRGNDPVLSGRPYWSFGPSFQFNNENFIFGSLILRFSFHPAPPEDAGFFGFSFSFTRNIRFEDLDPRPPNVLPYESLSRTR